MREVIVIGAGPVGLLLAGELARRGVDVQLLERRAQPGPGSRAIGLHAPVLAALEPSGITEHLLAEAVRVPRGEARAAGRTLGVVRFDRLGTRFPFVATQPQSATEQVFAALTPVSTRGFTVTAVAPRRDLVVVHGMHEGTPTEVTARLVVVSTGVSGRQLAYRPGAVPTRVYRDRYLMADTAFEAGPDAAVAVVYLDRTGVLESFPLPQGRRRFVAWDRDPGDDAPTARAERLGRLIAARSGSAAPGPIEAVGFGVRRFVAPRLRNGRLLVVGDAAHEVSPIGGQGMNLGLMDAVGLAPLLAEWLRTGEAPEDALHHWERRRVTSARRAAGLAGANTRLGRPLSPAANTLRCGTIRLALAAPSRHLLAHAYSMGFDTGT